MMSSKRTPPHPWHEGRPYGRPQNFSSMESGVSDRTNSMTRKQPSSQSKQQRRRSRSSSSSSRLWQLPKESIAGYAQWIQDKPEVDQTPAERRFLWKYMMRSLGLRQNSNESTTRSFVEKLESKLERSAMEDAFIRQYHRRLRERKDGKKSAAAASSDEPVIWWERPQAKPKAGMKKDDSFFSTTTVSPSSTSQNIGPTINLSGLQESMEKLGLSLDKLKEQDTMDDAFMK